MKRIIVMLVALALAYSVPVTAQDKANPASARSRDAEQEVLTLSKTKWRWMAERNVDSLTTLFRYARCASAYARRTRMPIDWRRAPGAGIRPSLPPARRYPVLGVPPGSPTGFRCAHVGRVIAGRALSASSCA